MSAHGCGFPTDFGGEHALCGTFLGLGELVPILCPACQAPPRTRQDAAGATPRFVPYDPATGPLGDAGDANPGAWVGIPLCEGCGLTTPTREHPALCDQCAAEYATDLAALDTRPEHPGLGCSDACGHCGMCGA